MLVLVLSGDVRSLHEIAALEMGDREDAVGWFLHGVLNRLRPGRMLLGVRYKRPRGMDEVRDHNIGVSEIEDLEAFFNRLPRTSLTFFKAILKSPTTAALESEIEEVVQRWHGQRGSSDHEASDRMNLMRSVEFSRDSARRVHAEVIG